jgi:hypothetical protein
MGLDVDGRHRGDALSVVVQAWPDQGAHAVRRAVAAVLGPWGGAGAVIDAYEAAIAHAVATQQDLARSIGVAPARSFVALCADLTRDVGAVQASAARWALDA